jgi:hypothetical protein
MGRLMLTAILAVVLVMVISWTLGEYLRQRRR